MDGAQHLDTIALDHFRAVGRIGFLCIAVFNGLRLLAIWKRRGFTSGVSSLQSLKRVAKNARK